MEVSRGDQIAKSRTKSGQKIHTIYFPRKGKCILFFSGNLLLAIVSHFIASFFWKHEWNQLWKMSKTHFFWMFSEAKPGVELQDKTFDTRCCALDSLCVGKGLKRPCRVFWPDMGGGKVMTSDSLTKVWLEESCRVGSPGDHGQSRGCKHKIAVTLLRIKHCVPVQCGPNKHQTLNTKTLCTSSTR